MTQVISPPSSTENEKIILGCMLNKTEYLKLGSDRLKEDDFQDPNNRIIYSALKSFYDSDRPIGVQLINEELKKIGKSRAVGGPEYIASLTQYEYAETSAHFEEYISILKEMSVKTKLASGVQEIFRLATDPETNSEDIIYKYREHIENISISYSRTIPISSMESRLSYLKKNLEQSRGKEYLGLCQKTLPELDEKLSGLRKLLILAAAPNAGKTALTNQLVIDVLKAHPEACAIYFSLEMTEEDVLIRFLCNQTQIDYRTFVMGRNAKNGDLKGGKFFNEEDLKRISEAEEFLKGLSNRLQVIDKKQCPLLTSTQAIAYIEEVKAKTGCNRAIVVIDYLQVWPLNPQGKFFNENEIDKWRIGEALKIRNALNGDPIIVISEARKPQGEDKWGGSMSAVMGSARNTYSPDGVLLLSTLDFQDILAIWDTDGQISKHRKKSALVQKNPEAEVEKLMEYLEIKKISLLRLDLAKGRDGMEKFSTILEFHYQKNVFMPANFRKLKSESSNFHGKNK